MKSGVDKQDIIDYRILILHYGKSQEVNHIVHEDEGEVFNQMKGFNIKMSN